MLAVLACIDGVDATFGLAWAKVCAADKDDLLVDASESAGLLECACDKPDLNARFGTDSFSPDG
jgi:hypothetical protein